MGFFRLEDCQFHDGYGFTVAFLWTLPLCVSQDLGKARALVGYYERFSRIVSIIVLTLLSTDSLWGILTETSINRSNPIIWAYSSLE